MRQSASDTRRGFDSPADCALFWRMAGSANAWRDASPTDRATFLTLFNNVPAWYATEHTILTYEAAAHRFEWRWYQDPAGYRGFISGTKIPRLWYPGPRIHALQQPAGGLGPIDLDDSPWVFVPRHVSAALFTAAKAHKPMGEFWLQDLGTAAADNLRDGMSDIASCNVVCINTYAPTGSILHFYGAGLQPHQGPTSSIVYGPILYDALKPYVSLFCGSGDFAATDTLLIKMGGVWRFDPRFLPESTPALRE